MAETSQTTAANDSTNTTNSVYRVHVSLDGGPKAGLPLDTGFESDRTFDNERDATVLADDIRENPMEYYHTELLDYPGTLNVVVSEDTPLAASEDR